MRDCDNSKLRQVPENARLNESQGLRQDDKAPAIGSIHHSTGGKSKQQDRDLLRKSDGSQVKGGVREAVYKPAQADALHPEADQRYELSGDKHPEISVPQRRK